MAGIGLPSKLLGLLHRWYRSRSVGRRGLDDLARYSLDVFDGSVVGGVHACCGGMLLAVLGSS